MWIAVFGGATLLAASASAWLLPQHDAAIVSIVAAVLFVCLVARGMFSVRSSLLERTHWRSDDAGEKRVALTFDDGPHPTWTPAVLDVLRARGVRATFFVIGENVRRHPEIVRRIHAEGHEIGCHGDLHSWATAFYPPPKLDADIRACREAVRDAIGATPRLYRPPIGIRSPAHVGSSARNDILIVGMARRGGDTSPDLDPATLARRFVASASGGEILALHDGEEPLHPVSREGTVAALPALLDGLEQKGLKPAPVSALLAERPYVETVSRGWTGKSRGGRLGMAIFAAGARLMGRKGCFVVAPFVAAWFVCTHPRGRRASVDLRRKLYGKGGPFVEALWVYRHFFEFGRLMIDRMVFLHGGAPPPEVESVGFEKVREAVESEGGFILMSAHVGDWIAASRASRLRSRRISIVAAQGMGVGPHQVSRDGGSHLFGVIDIDGDPIAVGGAIAAALRRGEIVAMLGDRRVSHDVVKLPFLGSEAPFPTGPWAVAMATGAPVVVFFLVRHADGRMRIEFSGPIRVARTSADRSPAIRAAAAQFVERLEDVVRRHPLHWSNFYDFWASN